jgi:hypothetical protein
VHDVTEPAQPLNITALFAEAAAKSGLLWVEIPEDRAWPVWHAWADDTVYVVSGPGEQTLPWLPGTVTLILRSKDTGGRLLTVHASTEVLEPGSQAWERAVEALRPGRLNALGDVQARWAEQCTIHAMRPYGLPLEQPGSYDQSARAVTVRPGVAATARWRPWHARGRPQRRRRAR